MIYEAVGVQHVSTNFILALRSIYILQTFSETKFYYSSCWAKENLPISYTDPAEKINVTPVICLPVVSHSHPN